jgi:hypothetical protein
LTNCRFSYAKLALKCTGYGIAVTTVSHSQFINCVQGFSLISSGGSGSSGTLQVTANNCLLANVSYLLDGSSQSGPASMYLTHCTVTNATKLIGPGTGLSVNVVAKNSIFSDVDAWGISGYYSMSGSYNGFHQVPSTFGNNNPPLQSAAPFQAGGAGHYYLKSNSPFRGAGTTTVGATLLNQLKSRTTQPPIEFPRWMQVSGELTLFPQIPRYTGGPPDLGYWYAALDYTVAAMILDGGSITVKPGAAVAVRTDCFLVFNEDLQRMEEVFSLWGFRIFDGSSFYSEGLPQSPNTFTAVELVQDGQPVNGKPFGKWWWVPCRAELFMIAGNDPEPVLNFRFSNFSLPNQLCYHFITGGNPYRDLMTVSWINTASLGLSLRDCNFTGGSIDVGYAGWIPDADPPAQYPGVANLDWQNNVFDRVTLNLNPASDPTAPSVDFVFQARNNLFRGSKETRIIPVVSSAGNWVFKDNLFDKVAFVQDMTNPLDHDYNAYWKRLSGELEPGQTDRLSMSAANDRVLTSAPTYQAGPLGDFYLATSSPLYSSGNRGSRSVTDAGLYHYTTRFDQMKDGAQSGNAIIGRHYVATTSSSTNRPKDSETPIADGVPDYVEDANGNNDANDISNAIETSPWLTQTATGIADSLNTTYDDTDLDGDGMVGRFEKALYPANPQPLAANNPLALTETTQIQPSVFQFKLLVNHELGESIGGLRLNVNGTGATLQEGDLAPDGNSLLVWNTLFDSPRQNYLQAELLSTPSGVEGSVLKTAGPVFPFYSDNVLQFFEAESLFDESGAYLDADLAEANATYTIQLYNPATETLIATIGPKSTSNGKIEEDWELNGYAGEGIRAVFNVTLLNAAGVPIQSGSGKRGIAKVSTKEGGRNFTWAYFYTPKDETRRTAFDTGGSVWNYMLNAVDVLMAPDWSYDVFFSDFNGYRGGAKPEDAGYVRTRAEVLSRLLPILKGDEAKQAYFYGHGNDGWVGDGQTGGAFMDARDVANALMNKVKPAGAYELDSKRPYRFVFVDGCSTGSGNAWRQAFGIVRLGAEGEVSVRGQIPPGIRGLKAPTL